MGPALGGSHGLLLVVDRPPKPCIVNLELFESVWCAGQPQVLCMGIDPVGSVHWMVVDGTGPAHVGKTGTSAASHGGAGPAHVGTADVCRDPWCQCWHPALQTTGLMANSRVGCFRVQPPVDNIQQNRDPVTISVAGAPLVGFVTRTYGNI